MKRGRKPNGFPLLATLALGGLVLVAIGLVLRGAMESRETQTTPTSPPLAAGETSPDTPPPEASVSHDAAPPRAAPPRATPVVDHEHALWQSPTQGEPVTLACVPQGVKCLLHINLSAIAASREAQQTWRALGTAAAEAVASWERQHGVLLSAQRRLLWATVPRADGTLAFLIRGEPDPSWSVPSSWQPLADQPGHYTSGDRAARIVEVASQRYWLLGDPDLVREADGDSSPVLQRQLARLRPLADRDRQVSLLTTARFLWTYGAEQFGSAVAPLLQPIEIGFGRDLQAIAFSCQTDEEGTYLELDTIWSGNVPRDRNRLRDKHAELVQRVWQGVLTRHAPPAYWQALAQRLPAMFAFFAKQIRVQREPRLVRANASLPPAAAHNLVLATELALNLSDADATPIDVPGGELLAQRITLQFGQQSLIDALQALEGEVQRRFPRRSFEVVVDGEALRAAGITRNQQIRDFDHAQTPIDQQLTELVRQANPAQAVSPADPAQKLVWVVENGEPTANSTVILITTRAAAAARSLDLPAVFTNS